RRAGRRCRRPARRTRRRTRATGRAVQDLSFAGEAGELLLGPVGRRDDAAGDLVDGDVVRRQSAVVGRGVLVGAVRRQQGQALQRRAQLLLVAALGLVDGGREQLDRAVAVLCELRRRVAVLALERRRQLVDRVLLRAGGQVLADDADGAGQEDALGGRAGRVEEQLAGLRAGEHQRDAEARGGVLLGERHGRRAGGPDHQRLGARRPGLVDHRAELGGGGLELLGCHQRDAVGGGLGLHALVAG